MERMIEKWQEKVGEVTIGATKELLAPIDPGLLFQEISPKALAKGMEDYLLNPENYFKFKSKCRETAEKYFSWEGITDQIEKIFIEIVADKNINRKKV